MTSIGGNIITTAFDVYISVGDFPEEHYDETRQTELLQRLVGEATSGNDINGRVVETIYYMGRLG